MHSVCTYILLKKKEDAHLVCFGINLLFKNSTKNLSSSYFILQLIQVKVHDFNPLPAKDKVQSLGILQLRDMHISRRCVILENL